MRNGLMALALVCAAAGIVHADVAKAKAANARGIALHKKKKFKEAAAEYRAAIAEDPTFMLAHYNLACVGSLMKDQETASREMAWVADRATWDDPATKAAVKGRKDKDLAWIRKESLDGVRLFSDEIVEGGIVDLLDKPWPELVGKPSSDAKLTKTVASAPGKHEASCNVAVVSAVYDKTKGGTVAGNLRDGLAVLDGSGAILARSEPLGCATSKDELGMLTQTNGVQTPYEYTDQDYMGTRLVTVKYAKGKDQVVTIFAYRDKDKKLTRAFDGVVANDAGKGTVYLTTVLGNLLYTAPGAKQRVYLWDSATGTFVPETK